MSSDLQEVTFSELIQAPKDTVEKLNQSSRHALRLSRRNDEDLILVAASRARQEEEIVGVAIRLLRAVINDSASRPDYLLDLLPVVFRWVRFLPPEDRNMFAEELVDVMEACEDLGNFAPVLDLVDQWRHSAEVYADPELVRAIHTTDRSDAGRVAPPAA